MLGCLETRGVTVDLTVEPGQRPMGPRVGERARGLLPEYRGVPTKPYRSSPSRFPAPDPGSLTGPVLVPLLSAPGIRGRRLPLPPTSRLFVPRLAAELLREPPPVLAMAARSDAGLDSRCDTIASNLEHLARHRQMTFITASAAIERLAL
jgi:hypothetical protein